MVTKATTRKMTATNSSKPTCKSVVIVSFGLTSNATSHDTDSQPSESLEPVVGAGNIFEAPSVRNATLAGAGRTKIAESQVCAQVGKFSELR